ncbi:MAG: altronate dehydratase [Spirochaetales bacterium]|nr:altronate dehydratase [Spirochaetales bacterium]
MDKTFIINPEDNVAVLLESQNDIPAGHKIALKDIKCGEKIIKYGYPIGRATKDIKKGEWVHTNNLKTLLSEKIEYHYSESEVEKYKKIASSLKAKLKDKNYTIQAYKREDGKVGVRNELWIIPTVGCVNKIAEKLSSWAEDEFPFIDRTEAWTHPFGCSQLGEDHENTKKILSSLVHHPNAGGVLVLGLGCENNTMSEFKKLVGTVDDKRIKFLVCQDVDDELVSAKALLTEIAKEMKEDVRTTLPLSSLSFGFKCGGSDGLSGITANALVGKFCDFITAIDGKAILTEVPEMFGAEQMLMNRAQDEATYENIVALINNFKDYFIKHDQVVYENPSPGNKNGGISTLEDKSLGCVQKGGKAIVTDVIKYGEQLKEKGLTLLSGPGNDIVSTTALSAAGVNMILFTTGRGTPLGSPVPTLKLATNHPLAVKKANWIDFDASIVLDKGFDIALEELINLIIKTANGEYLTKNEKNGYSEISIFKEGVIL